MQPEHFNMGPVADTYMLSRRNPAMIHEYAIGAPVLQQPSPAIPCKDRMGTGHHDSLFISNGIACFSSDGNDLSVIHLEFLHGTWIRMLIDYVNPDIAAARKANADAFSACHPITAVKT